MSAGDNKSAKSQAIKERFVEREVFGSISSVMERIFKDEKKELSIERDVLGFISLLMENLIKSGRKDRAAEREILERTRALIESIKSNESCEIVGEVENLYKYKIKIPDLHNLKIDEKIRSSKEVVLKTGREKAMKEIKEKIGELKGEENFSTLMLADEEISEETNKKNRDHIDERIEELQNYLSDIEKGKGKQQKISEWLHVSNLLHDNLQKKGEPVWNDGQVYVWGRCSTEKAVTSEEVISDICSDMKILEGQENEWRI
ncbi:MAG: hypothetical protein D8M57_10365 [Candidatus Scalindua sp. AMX11]|nr:MAG: hypothetical protein DWQ00_01500 [Candidatus Scalindua sp.]NOG85545.1 hypothetical protein [Planctomycetota bacterium]RZV90208.1 MAG: hypothetical protein EX341_06110 [Candidatus Scalindua sp. SCAELEC01]TDE64992.1 MAG: hypothetical protein D8M57_10365 [Candidatus Scalindua sp. AMX11]GJQ59574.1 MAG: hypothetical protein SCALA701_23750 [Candidatus Scalindua sp.]